MNLQNDLYIEMKAREKMITRHEDWKEILEFAKKSNNAVEFIKEWVKSADIFGVNKDNRGL